MSFEKSIFPDNLKIAKVTPVFKAGDNTELSDYRPISALLFVFEILELVIYDFISINTYLIQGFSIKNSLVFRKDIQPAMHFYNLQTKYTTILSKTTLL